MPSTNNTRNIEYEVRLTQPSEEFWGLKLWCNKTLEVTAETCKGKHATEQVDRLTLEKPAAVASTCPSLHRVATWDYLIAVNGRHLKNIQLQNAWELLMQFSKSASLTKPTRLLLHRHNYAKAKKKILPFAQKKQAQPTTTPSLQTEQEAIEQATTTLELDPMTEQHLIQLIQNDLKHLPQQIQQQNWQAFQYQSTTWFYSPQANDLFAEHPIRKEARILVCTTTLRTSAAIRTLEKSCLRHIAKKRDTQEATIIYQDVLDLVLKEIAQGFVKELSARQFIHRKQEPEISSPSKQTPKKPSYALARSKSAFKASNEEEDEDDDENEDDSPWNPVNLGRNASYWRKQKTSLQKTHVSPLKKQSSSPSKSKQRESGIPCNRKAIDQMVTRAACTIQKHIRSFLVRRQYPKSIYYTSLTVFTPRQMAKEKLKLKKYKQQTNQVMQHLKNELNLHVEFQSQSHQAKQIEQLKDEIKTLKSKLRRAEKQAFYHQVQPNIQPMSDEVALASAEKRLEQELKELNQSLVQHPKQEHETKLPPLAEKKDNSYAEQYQYSKHIRTSKF